MISKKVAVAAVLVLMFSLAASSALAATDCYLTVKGQKQGQFKGEGSGAQSGQIPAGQFHHDVVAPRDSSTGIATGREAATGKASGAIAAPRDAATGQASGKRQHGTIKIVKEVGPSSPQFAQAMGNGEVLTTVDIDFVRAGTGGKDEVYKKVTMMDAIVSSLHLVTGGAKPMEEITFTFDTQKIQFKDKSGKIMAMDSWSAQK